MNYLPEPEKSEKTRKGKENLVFSWLIKLRVKNSAGQTSFFRPNYTYCPSLFQWKNTPKNGNTQAMDIRIATPCHLNLKFDSVQVRDRSTEE